MFLIVQCWRYNQQKEVNNTMSTITLNIFGCMFSFGLVRSNNVFNDTLLYNYNKLSIYIQQEYDLLTLVTCQSTKTPVTCLNIFKLVASPRDNEMPISKEIVKGYLTSNIPKKNCRYKSNIRHLYFLPNLNWILSPKIKLEED